MQVKAIEIRDRNTFIPALAVLLRPVFVPALGEHSHTVRESSEAEKYLLRRAGYTSPDAYSVLLVRMDADGGPKQASADPYGWGGRTFPAVHQWLEQHWGEVTSGQVVDVEFILGESKEPKPSERMI